MSTSIQNNSEALQRILQTINNLPDVGSGGTQIQEYTGMFTTNNTGTATINVGFKPDLVAIDVGTYNNYKMYDAVMFTMANASELTMNVHPSSASHIITLLILTQTSTGFSVTAKDISTSLTQSNCNNRSFNYTAWKYT